MKTCALILAKSDSKRLKDKNILLVDNLPMYLINVLKCKKIFDKVYVSSNSLEILEEAQKAGAIPIKRSKELCGDVPNIPVYRHALKHIDEDIIFAIQANSPTIKSSIIRQSKKIMSMGYSELMTCDENYKLYGSIWALTRDRIKNYGDPYKQTPEVLIVDNSIDIHTQSDYDKVKNYKIYEDE